VIGTHRLVEDLFKAHGLESKLVEHRLMQAWPHIVGPQIAAHAAPTEVRANTLRVVVDSSTWLHELTLLKPILIEKLRRSSGGTLVHDVLFTIGNPPTASRPQPPSAPRTEPIQPADQALLDAALAPLDDPVLKDSVRRLVLRALTDPRRD
jgi:predicted nucleic acid-binding Zn ribbon protein